MSGRHVQTLPGFPWRRTVPFHFLIVACWLNELGAADIALCIFLRSDSPPDGIGCPGWWAGTCCVTASSACAAGRIIQATAATTAAAMGYITTLCMVLFPLMGDKLSDVGQITSIRSQLWKNSATERLRREKMKAAGWLIHRTKRPSGKGRCCSQPSSYPAPLFIMR